MKVKAGFVRSAVQGLVAVAVSLLVVRIPALAAVLTPEVQAVVVGLLVPFVVAVQLRIEAKFPALAHVLKSPVYGENVEALKAAVLDLLDSIEDPDERHLSIDEAEVDEQPEQG